MSPDDLSAIHADDALLDALGGRDNKPADTSDDVTVLLLAHRAHADGTSIRGLVSRTAAARVITHARRTR